MTKQMCIPCQFNMPAFVREQRLDAWTMMERRPLLQTLSCEQVKAGSRCYPVNDCMTTLVRKSRAVPVQALRLQPELMAQGKQRGLMQLLRQE